jgi:hypothetical protein
MKLLLTVLLFLMIPKAFAGVVTLNSLYYSDALTTSTEAKNTRTQYDLAVGIHIGSKKSVLAQLIYGSYASNDTSNSITRAYTQTDMGINFGFYIGKQRNWIFDIAYMITSKAKYNDGTGASEIEWRGTAIKADFGYLFDMDENFQFSTKLFYYAPTFIEEVSNTTTLTAVSYKRVSMYPGFAIYWVF